MADNPNAVVESLYRLKGDINDQVATPLAHALCMAGGNFNELSVKKRKNLAKSVKDPQLARWLEEADESLTKLFLDDVSEAMEASRARRTDGLISFANRAMFASQSTARRAAASNQLSFHGRRAEPYNPRQPFRRGGGAPGKAVFGGAVLPTHPVAVTTSPALATMVTPPGLNARPATKPPQQKSSILDKVGSRLSLFPLILGEISGHQMQFATSLREYI